jgi:signal transduction histidine kinase
MALNLNLSAMRAMLSQEDIDPSTHGKTLIARLSDSTELLKQTAHIVRNVVDDLRSPVLEMYGLLAALRWYGKQMTARAHLDILVQGDAPNPRPPAAIETTFFRIAQEVLNNIIKHAHANHVTVTLVAYQNHLRMIIVDDGVGFDPTDANSPEDQRQGLGLLTMRERAESVGGTFTITSSPNVGTQIIVQVNQ